LPVLLSCESFTHVSRSPSNIVWYWPKVWSGLLLFNGTFSTNRPYRAIEREVQCMSRRAGEQHNHTMKQWDTRINQENHTHSSAGAFWRRSPRHG